MTTSRMMLATALFGLLALPALAQPTIGAHQVRATHHRTVRHAPVHRVAATPEVKAPGTVAASPRAAVTAAPLAGASGGVTAPAGMSGAAVAPPHVAATVPSTTRVLPGTARTN